MGLSTVSFAVSLLTPIQGLAITNKSSQSGTQMSLKGSGLVLANALESGGSKYEKGSVVTAEMLTAPANVLVYPKGHTDDGSALINLHKLDTDKLTPPTILEQTDQGHVAYSAVCTHLGCTINWEQNPNEGSPRDHCPCHDGTYDPYGGERVTGGPPPRPAPQIGVAVNDAGEIVLTTEFEEPVGPQ